MNLIFHIFKKDIRRFKWLLILWLLVSFTPILWGVGDVFFGATKLETHTLFLNLGFDGAWFQWLLLVSLTAWVVQEETLVSDKAFWVTRPVSGALLAQAKGLFLGFFLVLIPLAAQAAALLIQGATLPETGWASLQMLLHQLETIALTALVAATTKNFGWFAPLALLGFLLKWIASNWMVLWRFFDKLSQSTLKPVALMESDATVAAVITVVGGFALLYHQYRTRNTVRTIRGAFACLALLALVPVIWRWDFQRPSYPKDPQAGSITLGLGKYSPVRESWPTTHDHRQAVEYFGHLEVKGGNPGDSFLPVRYENSMTLPDGKTVKNDGYDLYLASLWENLTSQWAVLPTSNGGTMSFYWWGDPDAGALQTLLGKTRILNPGQGGRSDFTFTRIDQGSYRRFCDQDVSYHADVDLVHYRYRVEAEIPVFAESGFKDGARSVTVMEVIPQSGVLQVKLQSQCLDLEFGGRSKNRKLLDYAEDNVFYILENKKKGEAYLPEPLYAYYPVDLFQQRQPIRVSRQLLSFQAVGFEPAEKDDPGNHDWYKDAVLVRVRMEPVGELTRPLDVARLSLSGNGGESLSPGQSVYVGHGLGIPTIQGYPTPAVKPEPVVQGKKLTAPGPALLVDDFEKGAGFNRLGGKWYSVQDFNKLGTVIHPVDFKPEAGGCPGSPRFAAHFYGHVGKLQSPFSWAQLMCDFNPKAQFVDLSGFSAIRFWTKGDGQGYSLNIIRHAVKDYAEFYSVFRAPKDWTQVTLPLSAFQQPFWSKQPLKVGWTDVRSLQFTTDPTVHDDEDFDFWIDQVELVK